MCRVKFKWKHCHETRKSSRTPWRPRRVAGHLASHLQPQAGGRCHQCIGRMQCPDQRRNRWLQGQWRSRRQRRTGQGSKRSPHRRMLPVVSPRWPRSKLLQFQCLWQAQTRESCEGQARRPWGMLRSTAARHRSWRGSEPSWQSEIMTSRDGLEVSGFTWAKQKKTDRVDWCFSLRLCGFAWHEIYWTASLLMWIQAVLTLSGQKWQTTTQKPSQPSALFRSVRCRSNGIFT